MQIEVTVLMHRSLMPEQQKLEESSRGEVAAELQQIKVAAEQTNQCKMTNLLNVDHVDRDEEEDCAG